MTVKTLLVAATLLAFSSQANAQQNNPKLHQLFDDYFKEINVIDPINATYNGIASCC